MVRRGGAGFACYIFLQGSRDSYLRSWLLFPVLPLGVSGGGLKKKHHRQVRFWLVGWKLFLACSVSPRAGSEIVV